MTSDALPRTPALIDRGRIGRIDRRSGRMTRFLGSGGSGSGSMACRVNREDREDREDDCNPPHARACNRGQGDQHCLSCVGPFLWSLSSLSSHIGLQAFVYPCVSTSPNLPSILPLSISILPILPDKNQGKQGNVGKNWRNTKSSERAAP